MNTGNGRRLALNVHEATEMLRSYACVCYVSCVCLHTVAEKTTGAMGNIVAATGLVKKDEFPADMNVCISRSLLSPSLLHYLSHNTWN